MLSCISKDGGWAWHFSTSLIRHNTPGRSCYEWLLATMAIGQHWRQNASEQQLLGITISMSAVALISCMWTSQRHLVVHCENIMLAWSCCRPLHVILRAVSLVSSFHSILAGSQTFLFRNACGSGVLILTFQSISLAKSCLVKIVFNVCLLRFFKNKIQSNNWLKKQRLEAWCKDAHYQQENSLLCPDYSEPMCQSRVQAGISS